MGLDFKVTVGARLPVYTSRCVQEEDVDPLTVEATQHSNAWINVSCHIYLLSSSPTANLHNIHVHALTTDSDVDFCWWICVLESFLLHCLSS